MPSPSDPSAPAPFQPAEPPQRGWLLFILFIASAGFIIPLAAFFAHRMAKSAIDRIDRQRENGRPADGRGLAQAAAGVALIAFVTNTTLLILIFLFPTHPHIPANRMKDATQIRGIILAMDMFSSDSNDFWPSSSRGKIRAPGPGAAQRLSLLYHLVDFPPSMFCSPKDDRKPYTGAKQSAPPFTNILTTDNLSYALLDETSDAYIVYESTTAPYYDVSVPVLADRKITTPGAPSSFFARNANSPWEGNVGFADAHVDYLKGKGPTPGNAEIDCKFSPSPDKPYDIFTGPRPNVLNWD